MTFKYSQIIFFLVLSSLVLLQYYATIFALTLLSMFVLNQIEPLIILLVVSWNFESSISCNGLNKFQPYLFVLLWMKSSYWIHFGGACQWSIFVNLKNRAPFLPYPMRDQDKFNLSLILSFPDASNISMHSFWKLCNSTKLQT